MCSEMYRTYAKTPFASTGDEPNEQGRGVFAGAPLGYNVDYRNESHRVGGHAPVKPNVSREGPTFQPMKRQYQECVSRDMYIGKKPKCPNPQW